MPNQNELRRTLSLPLLCFYGLGTILGAGIYVLVGEVAGIAGMWAPLAFLAAGLVAAFTAFSYAELASRLPKSAGEATYLQEAFHLKVLAVCAGWGVVATGIISAATVTNGFVGYLHVFVAVPDVPIILASILIMGGLAAWGVGQSVMAASIVTVLEISGLLLVILLAGHHLADLPQRWREVAPPLSPPDWKPIMLGGYLAFFAFIGFEDIVNLAEEVVEPRRNIAKAITICLAVSSIFYVVIALIAVLAMPPEQLAQTEAPLAAILAQRGPWAQSAIAAISVVAVINGALIQIIMASRVLYGMGKIGIAPAFLAKVHPHTQTPLIATLLVTGVIALFALSLPLVSLAKATSSITLFVFALVNAALWRIKRRDPAVPGTVSYPIWVAVTGCLLSATCLLATLVLGF